MKKIILLSAIMSVIISSCVSGPDACECISLLEIKKDKSEYVYGMTNEEYRKWEKCYDAYAGPATATLKCSKK
jgi:hypothetical protein